MHPLLSLPEYSPWCLKQIREIWAADFKGTSCSQARFESGFWVRDEGRGLASQGEGWRLCPWTPKPGRRGARGVPKREKTRKGKRNEPLFGAKKYSFRRDGALVFGMKWDVVKGGADLEGEYQS